MQSDPSGRSGVEPEALEREIQRLPDVSSARVVADQSGRVVEIHVLAASDKHPKQIVRDIQSVAMASFGLDVDRRLVSVVRLDGTVDVRTREPRIVLRAISADQQGYRSIVRVTLERADREVTGTAEGSLASTARLRLAATAALDALRKLMPVAASADIETATVVRAVERDVAMVNVVVAVSAHEEIMSGSAVVRESGEMDAVVRAVLDATNRRLPQIQSAVASERR
jgi:hypothetical protein